MRYVPLGTTGLQVSPLCLGAMMFGAWGNPDHEACVRIIHRALDEGINFVDTANVYSAGESEEIVGKALKASGSRRDEVVLATKFHAPMGPGPNDRGNNRKHIFTAVEDSLRRLGTDYIDLYQAHRPDPATDVADTLGALSDLVHQGKVRWVGSSTFPAREIVEALVPLAEKEGVPLPVLGVAWTIVHPSVTSAIIGPRTMEQLEGLLPAADLDISDATLDAIDETVPPGETVNNADLGFENIWLRPERRRRSFTRT